MQISRLQDAGYPRTLLVSICENICAKIKRQPEGDGRITTKQPRAPYVVAPYIHGVTHRLKKIAGRKGVQVICSAPNKAYSMCRKVNREGNNEETGCDTSHKTRHTECTKEVVYQIPLSCGKCYIGQTGRCINDRTREHAASVKAITAAGHLAAHCRVCTCAPKLNNIDILARHRTKVAREILEAVAIDAKEENCVSTPSIALHQKELTYLRRAAHLAGT